jgi:CheY-like chemotaxis protein
MQIGQLRVSSVSPTGPGRVAAGRRFTRCIFTRPRHGQDLVAAGVRSTWATVMEIRTGWNRATDDWWRAERHISTSEKRDMSTRHAGRPRVLLADDYAEILTALERLLKPFCNIVGLVENGQRLLESARVLQPDVVVADVFLPEVDGLEACRRIKEAIPHVQVIILSAADDVETRTRAMEVGAFAFISKRHAADRLRGTIERAFAAQT